MKYSLTNGCPTLKASRPFFPLTPFGTWVLVCIFLCFAFCMLSRCLGENRLSRLLHPTLYLLAHDLEQKRLERVKVRAGALLPQNSQVSMLPSSTDEVSGKKDKNYVCGVLLNMCPPILLCSQSQKHTSLKFI